MRVIGDLSLIVYWYCRGRHLSHCASSRYCLDGARSQFHHLGLDQRTYPQPCVRFLHQESSDSGESGVGQRRRISRPSRGPPKCSDTLVDPRCQIHHHLQLLASSNEHDSPVRPDACFLSCQNTPYRVRHFRYGFRASGEANSW